MEALDLLHREFDRLYTNVRDEPVTASGSVAQVRERVAQSFDLTQATALEAVATRATILLREHALHSVHPRYFGLFNPSVHPSGILADALVALYNPQMAGWSHAPAANEIERLVLRHFIGAVGLPLETSVGHFTSGGNEANHTAVIAALAHAWPAWLTGGIRALPGAPRLYASAEAHHSLLKVARATGMGEEALREIPVDGSFRMRVDALEAAINADRAAGHVPIAVVGTAGTTGLGAIDPLPVLADVCRRHQIWFHVDAAWGGVAALSPRLRVHLPGIERADSVTVDAHKWLSVPLGAGAFLTRHPDACRKAFRVSTGYVPPTEAGAEDLYRASIQWSRRFIGLKVLFVLATEGSDGIAMMIEGQAAMGALIRARLQASGWQALNDTPFPLVVFSHPSFPRDEDGVRSLTDRLVARGRAWVSAVKVPEFGWALRACVTSFRTNEGDVDVLMEELAATLKA